MPIPSVSILRVAVLCAAWLAHGAPAADLDAYRKALAAGDPQVLAAMVRADAGRTPTGPSDGSLLHLACSHNYTKQQGAMVAALIAAGANLEARDMYGGTPLNWAAGTDCLDCVQLLLNAGAQVMSRNARGATPLHVAGPRVAAVLMAAGADPLAADLQSAIGLDAGYASRWPPTCRATGRCTGSTTTRFWSPASTHATTRASRHCTWPH